MGITLKRKIQSHRDLSLVITIPKEIVEEMKLIKGDIIAFNYNGEEKNFTCYKVNEEE
ncbi:MAG TPA: hypothetical protein VMZ91_05860 [Candidatus Paceibacterota bacterium]|nr:hypothetical protein [Candidatus Paceibacterota bacterium]